jgi:hypothetical protein
MGTKSGLTRKTELLIKEHIGYCEACGDTLNGSEWNVHRLSDHIPYGASDIILLCPACQSKVDNGSVSDSTLIACTETREGDLESWISNALLEDANQRPLEDDERYYADLNDKRNNTEED